ncbi:hypothetical protein IMCC3317_34200 [Kordia antarctica]|uniref:Uncharacterized protein n=1 Tax=Kordia antarctica TaxID=1218801 RepID=A0A7L4ZPB3_9FLAO|nr:hypothetical protein [Kordia antarctica]QHI38036.1 hypothetical protein IMCC3317_34200 [Kordia antarctica]
MRKFLILIPLAFTLGMTSCSVEELDDEQTNISATDNASESPSENTGEEEELEPNE